MLRRQWECARPVPLQDGRKRRKPQEKLPCPPSSLCVRCYCSLLHPRAWNLSPWSGIRCRSEPCPAESCGSAGAAGQSSQDGTGWWHGSAGRTASATPPHSLSKDGLPRGLPISKANTCFLKVVARNFPLSPQWLSDGTASPRESLAVPSPTPCPLPHRPLSRPLLTFP